MLKIGNLNMYFNGNSSIKLDEETNINIANFHSNYDGNNSINFSINIEDITKLNENLDVCIEDFKDFVKKVLTTSENNK